MDNQFFVVFLNLDKIREILHRQDKENVFSLEFTWVA